MNIKKSTLVLLIAVFALSMFIQSASAAPGDIMRVSVASDGTQGNGNSGISKPSMSSDGRYIVFSSGASNLVSGDTNGKEDIFLHDRNTGTTIIVSVASDGTQGNDTSTTPCISSDGRYVVFKSSANNLVSGDTNNYSDVFLRDLLTNTTTRVSVSSSGVQGNGFSDSPAISGNGQYIVFASDATNLIGGDVNFRTDIFLHNTQNSSTIRVSLGLGVESNHNSFNPIISDNGRLVFFESWGNNIVSGDNNNRPDVFMYDTQTNITILISRSSSGTIGNDSSSLLDISSDGRYVVFSSSANNLVSGDTNSRMDYFLRDTINNSTTRVTVHSNGTQSNLSSNYGATVSNDGRFVIFGSSASNLVDNDLNGSKSDLFIRDINNGQTILISTSASGVQGNLDSTFPVITDDGSYIAFASLASNLISGDTNNFHDLFILEFPIKISSTLGHSSPTNSNQITFNVFFTETMLNVDITDFNLVTTGSINGASITNLSGSDSAYIITVETGTGDGSLYLEIPNTATITDQGGNTPNGLPFNSPNYLIDRTYPQVASITRSGNEINNSNSVNFVVSFSEAVINVDAEDFILTSTGEISNTSITNISGSGASRTITVSTGSGDGTLRLDLIDNDSITDIASNALGNTGLGNGSFNSGQSYSIVKSPPTVNIKLIEPKQRLVTNNPTLTFIWNQVTPVASYEIVISTNRNFSNIVLQQTVTSTSFTPSSPLSDGLYYWRVRHFNSGFSAPQYFTVDTTPPVVPTLTSPRNTAILKTTPNFRWTRVSGATLFEFRYDDSADCASPIYTITTRYNYHKPPTIPSGTYYWCVRAKDSVDNWSNLSTPNSFTISP
ncbi:MAG: PD40 domain-containing protein [Anaerolineales bacterium]|nr:PD40 domain-containing protein [Anaerolineales bacterium]